MRLQNMECSLIKDQEFSKAIQNFLDNESQLIDNQKEKLEDYLPFKN